MQFFEPVRGVVGRNETQSRARQSQRVEYAEKTHQRCAQSVDAQSFSAEHACEVHLKDVAEGEGEDGAGEIHSGLTRDVSDLGAKLLRLSRAHFGRLVCDPGAHDTDLKPGGSSVPDVNNRCRVEGSI